VAKVEYKKFKATIVYEMEMTEDFVPQTVDEVINWTDMIAGDPEIMNAKVKVEEGE
jgi:hypothetical protein